MRDLKGSNSKRKTDAKVQKDGTRVKGHDKQKSSTKLLSMPLLPLCSSPTKTMEEVTDNATSNVISEPTISNSVQKPVAGRKYHRCPGIDRQNRIHKLFTDFNPPPPKSRAALAKNRKPVNGQKKNNGIAKDKENATTTTATAAVTTTIDIDNRHNNNVTSLVQSNSMDIERETLSPPLMAIQERTRWNNNTIIIPDNIIPVETNVPTDDTVLYNLIDIRKRQNQSRMEAIVNCEIQETRNAEATLLDFLSEQEFGIGYPSSREQITDDTPVHIQTEPAISTKINYSQMNEHLHNGTDPNIMNLNEYSQNTICDNGLEEFSNLAHGMTELDFEDDEIIDDTNKELLNVTSKTVFNQTLPDIPIKVEEPAIKQTISDIPLTTINSTIPITSPMDEQQIDQVTSDLLTEKSPKLKKKKHKKRKVKIVDVQILPRINLTNIFKPNVDVNESEDLDNSAQIQVDENSLSHSENSIVSHGQADSDSNPLKSIFDIEELNNEAMIADPLDKNVEQPPVGSNTEEENLTSLNVSTHNKCEIEKEQEENLRQQQNEASVESIDICDIEDSSKTIIVEQDAATETQKIPTPEVAKSDSIEYGNISHLISMPPSSPLPGTPPLLNATTILPLPPLPVISPTTKPASPSLLPIALTQTESPPPPSPPSTTSPPDTPLPPTPLPSEIAEKETPPAPPLNLLPPPTTPASPPPNISTSPPTTLETLPTTPPLNLSLPPTTPAPPSLNVSPPPTILGTLPSIPPSIAPTMPPPVVTILPSSTPPPPSLLPKKLVAKAPPRPPPLKTSVPPQILSEPPPQSSNLAPTAPPTPPSEPIKLTLSSSTPSPTLDTNLNLAAPPQSTKVQTPTPPSPTPPSPTPPSPTPPSPTPPSPTPPSPTPPSPTPPSPTPPSPALPSPTPPSPTPPSPTPPSPTSPTPPSPPLLLTRAPSPIASPTPKAVVEVAPPLETPSPPLAEFHTTPPPPTPKTPPPPLLTTVLTTPSPHSLPSPPLASSPPPLPSPSLSPSPLSLASPPAPSSLSPPQEMSSPQIPIVPLPFSVFDIPIPGTPCRAVTPRHFEFGEDDFDISLRGDYEMDTVDLEYDNSLTFEETQKLNQMTDLTTWNIFPSISEIEESHLDIEEAISIPAIEEFDMLHKRYVRDKNRKFHSMELNLTTDELHLSDITEKHNWDFINEIPEIAKSSSDSVEDDNQIECQSSNFITKALVLETIYNQEHLNCGQNACKSKFKNNIRIDQLFQDVFNKRKYKTLKELTVETNLEKSFVRKVLKRIGKIKRPKWRISRYYLNAYNAEKPNLDQHENSSVLNNVYRHIIRSFVNCKFQRLSELCEKTGLPEGEILKALRIIGRKRSTKWRLLSYEKPKVHVHRGH